MSGAARGGASPLRWLWPRLLLLPLLSACGSSKLVEGGAAAACPFAPPAGAVLVSSCGQSSWTAGTSELCQGHLVYRDYVYDDYGADHPVPTIRWNPTSTNAVVLPSGDDRYPVGAENTADLVRFEMQLDGDQLEVEFELNTLYDAQQTIAVVAIDTDNDPATGGGLWPGFNTGSQGWDEIHVLRNGDPASNRITGRFPAPKGAAWRIWAAVAQADGMVMNVAFRGSDETVSSSAISGAWFDQRQATALAQGDVSAFSVGVCPEELRAGVTRGAVMAPGFHERVYTSAYTLPPGEGISINGIEGPRVDKQALDPRVYQAFNFLGRYQPYAYYLPDQPGPHGLQLLLHGFSQTHTANVSSASVQARFGDDLNRVLISPLGRGLAGAYSDISERDVLDVLDDAQQAFSIDAMRVIVSGISMGGYGQLAFGTLYPGRFAGMLGWVSPTGNFSVFPAGQPLTYIPGSLVANTALMVGNLLNTPLVLLYGAADEFVPVFESAAMLQQLQGNDPGAFDFYLNADTDHLTTFDNDHRKEAALSAAWQLPAQVARVRFHVDPTLDVPQYGIAHDRAWWISSIHARDAGDADLDLRSAGCGLASPVTEDGSETGAGPLPIVWQRTYRHIVSSTPNSAENRIDGALQNIASLHIDAGAACLSSGPVRYHLTTDGPAQLLLSDGRQLTLPAAGSFDGSF